MTTLRTELLVIGGGATGAGVAWDAALRGYDVVLAERSDLGEGTSGRFHGLLHSGGRYAVKDPARYVDPGTGTVLVKFVNETEQTGFSFDVSITGDVE